LYQGAVQSVKDGDLLRASESIRSILAQRAKAPLLSTAVSKADTADRFHRSHSQLTPISDLHEGSNSTISFLLNLSLTFSIAYLMTEFSKFNSSVTSSVSFSCTYSNLLHLFLTDCK